MSQVLTENFIVELFKACLSSQSVLEITNKYLEDFYLPEESYKKVWNVMRQQFELTNKVPTLGILNEQLKTHDDALKLLVSIKRIKIPDVDVIFPTFEKFIKEVRFIELYTETGKLWNQEKQNEAIALLARKSDEILKFSLREGIHGRIVRDFEKRNEDRKLKDKDVITKIKFGIHPMDYDTNGGGKIGTSGLLLARSGTGKTTFETWVGINNAREGGITVHFQIEGTEDELKEMYDSSLSGIPLEEIEFNGIPKDRIQVMKNIMNDFITKKGEIYIVAPEKFGTLSIEECDATIEEIEKNHGKVTLAIFDNISSFTVKGKFSNSEQGERKRREEIANSITNIAVSRKLFALATEQANDVQPIKFNDPSFVMTRSDISEFKGMLRPFSYFWTWNQTTDEYHQNVGRIYNDKFRKHRSGQVRHIATSYQNARFYNSMETLKKFWDVTKNAPK